MQFLLKCCGFLTNQLYWEKNSPQTRLSIFSFELSSVQFSRSVMSDSLRPHESQQGRLQQENVPNVLKGLYFLVEWVCDTQPQTFDISVDCLVATLLISMARW